MYTMGRRRESPHLSPAIEQPRTAAGNDSFRRIGKFNQNIRSWGYEDVEFFERATKLGLTIRRLANMPDHLGHGRTKDSNPHNRHYTSNREHYERTRNASPRELGLMVQQWSW